MLGFCVKRERVPSGDTPASVVSAENDPGNPHTSVSSLEAEKGLLLSLLGLAFRPVHKLPHSCNGLMLRLVNTHRGHFARGP